jgi:HD-GYP domain-containing protein (c-di-GMP phosphodiesterase class II)
MRNHPLIGAQIVAPFDFFTGGALMIRHHHERWDGSGYPEGLKGDDIPLAARICAVCDVFDALLSPRPYKDPWPLRDVMTELASLRGTHLDPALVDAFLPLAVDLYDECFAPYEESAQADSAA